ncbi:MAG TPA: TolC family protein [Opitutaceae bacterium]|nr:TolC family protein [Opitutaceae bacterium]
MRIAVFCAALTAAMVPVSARAQSPALTESEALARLSADSPRVRAIRGAVDVARADVLAAGRFPNPRVMFDREAVAGTTEYLTRVGQALPISGYRGLQVRAASALVDAASNRADEEIRRARADLRLAFAQLVAAQNRELELAAARERMQGVAGVLAKREAAGDAAGFDRLRADREVLDLEADRAAAATERARAQASLAVFYPGSVPPATLVAVSGAPAQASLPTVDALVEHAESIRGDLLALRKEIESAQLAGRAAERRWIPEPDVIAGTKSSSLGSGDMGSVLGVQATIALFDRGRPERALAQARVSQAEARTATLQVLLRAEIAGWRAAVIERRDTAARYRAGAMNSVDQIERIAQVSYEAGERGILELLDAYRTRSTARVRQIALDASVREAEIELEYVSGWEIR